MKLDLSNENDLFKAQTYFDMLCAGKFSIELKKLSDKRTSQQNRALHKFFVLISNQLNEIGQEFCYTGLKGLELSTRYTPEIVKNFFWRPIQLALYDIESTKKLTTEQINGVTDVIIKFFGDKGILIEFPNRDNL